jgi:hypothetical protein
MGVQLLGQSVFNSQNTIVQHRQSIWQPQRGRQNTPGRHSMDSIPTCPIPVVRPPLALGLPHARSNLDRDKGLVIWKCRSDLRQHADDVCPSCHATGPIAAKPSRSQPPEACLQARQALHDLGRPGRIAVWDTEPQSTGLCDLTNRGASRMTSAPYCHQPPGHGLRFPAVTKASGKEHSTSPKLECNNGDVHRPACMPWPMDAHHTSAPESGPSRTAGSLWLCDGERIEHGMMVGARHGPTKLRWKDFGRESCSSWGIRTLSARRSDNCSARDLHGFTPLVYRLGRSARN